MIICLYIFDSEDKLIKKFGKNDDGEFQDPQGICFDSNNHLYVVDGR